MKIKVLLKSDVKSSGSLFLFGAAQAKIKRNIKKLFSLAARPSLALFRRATATRGPSVNVILIRKL